MGLFGFGKKKDDFGKGMGNDHGDPFGSPDSGYNDPSLDFSSNVHDPPGGDPFAGSGDPFGSSSSQSQDPFGSSQPSHASAPQSFSQNQGFQQSMQQQSPQNNFNNKDFELISVK